MRPFLAILIASELFGHEKGAFTGATQRRLGRFELAKEARSFSTRSENFHPRPRSLSCVFCRNTSSSVSAGLDPIRADVRVIAATNRDLQAAIGAGTFRSDLFYRLQRFPD